MLLLKCCNQFRKKHSILLLLFVISIIWLIKNSDIPYFFDPPIFLAVIFDKPPESEFFSGIAEIVDIFASAYLTSLLFYFLVEYMPSAEKEEQANKIIDAILVRLYSYMSYLLVVIGHSAKKQNVSLTDELDKLLFTDEIIRCSCIKLKDGEECERTQRSYSLLKECDNFRNIILSACRNISSTPCFQYCDMEIVNLVSRIQLLDMMLTIPEVSRDKIQVNRNVYCMSLKKDYPEALKLKEGLGKKISVRIENIKLKIISVSINKIPPGLPQSGGCLFIFRATIRNQRCPRYGDAAPRPGCC